MAEQHTLLVDAATDGLRILRLNNPARKNAINRATYRKLTALLDEYGADASVAVVALTGVGEFFSSGNDMGSVDPAADRVAYMDEGHVILRRLIQAIARFPKLLVAVVNGPAIGIAATVLPLCDVVYAVKTAWFYTPFTALGLSAEGGSSYTFPRILGPSKAAEMLLLNHRLTAAEALRSGFVAELFDAEELDAKLWPQIRGWPQLAQQSLRATKSLMRSYDEQELLGAVEQEMRVLRERNASEEAAEAVKKFMARSKKSKL